MADPLLPEISSAIRSLFSTRVVTTPISSLNLLGRIIASSHKAPLLRLHELHRFEGILESLSQPQGWEHGTVTLLKNSSGVVVMNVVLVKKLTLVPYDSSSGSSNPKKRKRPPVDEEAESREGSEHGQSSVEEEEIRPPKPAASSLSNLSVEMKEIYEILQKPTARGKLLAEQVLSLSKCVLRTGFSRTSSVVPSMEVSSPFALMLPSRTASKHSVPPFHTIVPA